MRIIEYSIGALSAKLISYIHEDFSSICNSYRKRPAIIICPGGAYEHLSLREQDPVAVPFFSSGFQVFILRYSVACDIKKSEPEEELAEAIALIKEKEDELNVVSSKIAVMGFSAGGHLAASICCHWNRYGINSKPDCGVLCYPVITMGEYKNTKSTEMLCFNSREREEYFSLENGVSDFTLPCFVWHTTEDEAVPLQNSLMFVEALTKNKIPYEYHVFQRGVHGLSTGHRETGIEEKEVQTWVGLCIAWLNKRWDFVL